MSAAGEVREKVARKAAGIPRMGILGTRGAGFWRSQRVFVYFGAGAGGAWGESHWARIHWRSLRRFLVQSAAQSGIRESANFPESRRWIAAEGCLHCGGCALRASGKQTAATRNFELPRIFAARTGSPAARCSAGARENRVGRISGNPEAGWDDQITRGLQICSWRGRKSQRACRACLAFIIPASRTRRQGASPKRCMRKCCSTSRSFLRTRKETRDSAHG